MHMWRGAVETNVQKMQVLLETVRAGSFTRAAERLSYSQSGVSRMVADLEADWGFKVLDRSREGVVLSADGRADHAGGRGVVRGICSFAATGG